MWWEMMKMQPWTMSMWWWRWPVFWVVPSHWKSMYIVVRLNRWLCTLVDLIKFCNAGSITTCLFPPDFLFADAQLERSDLVYMYIPNHALQFFTTNIGCCSWSCLVKYVTIVITYPKNYSIKINFQTSELYWKLNLLYCDSYICMNLSIVAKHDLQGHCAMYMISIYRKLPKICPPPPPLHTTPLGVLLTASSCRHCTLSSHQCVRAFKRNKRCPQIVPAHNQAVKK